jgi:hypothetical protein
LKQDLKTNKVYHKENKKILKISQNNKKKQNNNKIGAQYSNLKNYQLMK